MSTGAVRRAFARQAREDWQAFLAHRARELRPGGRLVVVGSAADANGLSGAEGLVNLANGALGELVAEGHLRADECRRMVIPCHYRTRREFAAPFAKAPHEALTLVEDHLFAMPDPLWDALQADGNVEAYAADYAAFFRAAFGPSLMSALDADRSSDDRRALADRLDRLLRSRIAADPAGAACHWRLLTMLIARKTAAGPAARKPHR